MKVKFGLIGLAMVSIVDSAHAAEQFRKGAQETSRYSVETVEYESSSGARGLYNRKIVIKTDTATGKTWFLKDMPNKGIDSSGTTKYWVEIEDLSANKYPAFEPAK